MAIFTELVDNGLYSCIAVVLDHGQQMCLADTISQTHAGLTKASRLRDAAQACLVPKLNEASPQVSLPGTRLSVNDIM